MPDAPRSFPAEPELEALAASLRRADELLAEQSVLRRHDATVSHWTVAQQLDHALQATHHSLAACQLLHRAAETAQPDDRIRQNPEPDRAGDVVLQRARIPRGRAQTPEHVAPQPTPDPEALARAAATCREQMAALSALAAELASVPGALPHPLLGDFSATDWLRFARIHLDHHLDIAEEILADGGNCGG